MESMRQISLTVLSGVNSGNHGKLCAQRTLLGVVGRIQTRSYENQQGQRVYVTEVVCDNFQLLERKAKDQRTLRLTKTLLTGFLNKSEGNSTPNQNNDFKKQNNQPSMPGLSEHGFHTPHLLAMGATCQTMGCHFNVGIEMDNRTL